MTVKKTKLSIKKTQGFTLIEVMLSIIILAIAAMSISESFNSGFKASENRVKEAEALSYAKGMMEVLNAVDFSLLSSGSDTVTIDLESVPRTWTVAGYDMDGDAVTESDAKKVTVIVRDITLQGIVIKSKGLVTMKR